MPDVPDLFAELGAAEAVINGDVAEVKTQYGSCNPDDPGEKVFVYGSTPICLHEDIARHAVASRNRLGLPSVLLRRTITIGEWEEVPGP